MVSSITFMAVTDGFEPNEKPRQVDLQDRCGFAAACQQTWEAPGEARRRRCYYSRLRRAAVASRRLPNDLGQLGDQLHFSIDELAKLSDRSAATIFRYLRLGLLSCIRVGGYRRFRGRSLSIS